MSAQVIELANGDCAMGIDPELGGAITYWRWRGIDVLRRAATNPQSSRQCGCFALLPYSNRIVRGQLLLGGTVYSIAPNDPDHAYPLHGTGWQASWRVEARTLAAAVLAFEQTPVNGRWPWAFRATQRLELTERGAEVALAMTNCADRPTPAGMGLHPYFPRDPSTRLQARVQSVLLNDANMAPIRRVPLPPEWNFANSKTVDGLPLDNCFSGWDGRAQLDWPSRNMRLVIEAEPVFAHLVVYVPARGSFWCVEPVSHINDGFNRFAAGAQDTGTIMLQPGATLAGRVRFGVSQLA
jgi:aldose 1-epimerase